MKPPMAWNCSPPCPGLQCMRILAPRRILSVRLRESCPGTIINKELLVPPASKVPGIGCGKKDGCSRIVRLVAHPLLARGLLLHHAVQRAESPDQVAGIDWDDLPRREQIRQRVQSNAIIQII